MVAINLLAWSYACGEPGYNPLPAEVAKYFPPSYRWKAVQCVCKARGACPVVRYLALPVASFKQGEWR